MRPGKDSWFLGKTKFPISKSLLTDSSVFYDAVFVPGGAKSVATLAEEPDAVHFLNEAFRHCKAIAGHADAMQIFQETFFSKKLKKDGSGLPDSGVVVGADSGQLSKLFIEAISKHRFWEREAERKVPA